jgi:hypothetical protein
VAIVFVQADWLLFARWLADFVVDAYGRVGNQARTELSSVSV